MKYTTTISIDAEIHKLAKLKGLNISQVSEEALRERLKVVLDPDNRAMKEIDKIQKSWLKDFLENVTEDFVNNQSAMNFWAFKTGKTIEELIELKKKYMKEHPEPQKRFGIKKLIARG